MFGVCGPSQNLIYHRRRSRKDLCVLRSSIVLSTTQRSTNVGGSSFVLRVCVCGPSTPEVCGRKPGEVEPRVAGGSHRRWVFAFVTCCDEDRHYLRNYHLDHATLARVDMPRLKGQVWHQVVCIPSSAPILAMQHGFHAYAGQHGLPTRQVTPHMHVTPCCSDRNHATCAQAKAGQPCSGLNVVPAPTPERPCRAGLTRPTPCRPC